MNQDDERITNDLIDKYEQLLDDLGTERKDDL